MERKRLKELLDKFPALRIAVVGDYFLDKWLEIDRSLDEPSLETGLTAYQVVAKRCYAGAAGTVVSNLAALETGKLFALGFLGNDGEGFELIRHLKKMNVNTDLLITSDSVMTPTYTKPVFLKSDGIEETNRLDHKNTKPTPAELERKIIDAVWKIAPDVDAIIALDQLCYEGYGVVTPRLREELAKISDKYPELVIYADSRAFISRFKNITIKCNDIEAAKLFGSGKQSGSGSPPPDEVKKCLLRLSDVTGHPVFITCGSKGVMVMDDRGKPTLVSTIKLPPGTKIDTVGAGDSCTSGIVTALCAGASPMEAAFIGNLVAGCTIQIIGTTGTASRGDLLALYERYYG